MRKGDEKRQAILDVAEKLFYTKGYDATSVQDVLDVLKTSKGSFYHHFESKEQLLATLCDQRAERALRQAEEVMDSISDPLARLNTVLSHAMPLRHGEEKFLTLLLPLLDQPTGMSLRVGYQEALIRRFEPLLQEEVALCRQQELVFPPDYAGFARLVLELTNQCWLEAARLLLQAARTCAMLEPAALAEMIDLYRFAVERLLDAPFASIELVRVPELMTVLQPVLVHMNLPMGL